MKHLLSLFAVVLFSMQATAQETIKDGMVWNTRVFGTHEPNPTEVIYTTVVRGDTLINETPALKVYNSVDDGPEMLEAVIRLEGEKVLFWHHGTSQWLLAYDFGLKEGEGCLVGNIRGSLQGNNGLGMTYIKCVKESVLEAYDEKGERFEFPALYVEEYDTEKCEVRYGEGCWLKGIASTNGFLFNNRFEVEGRGSTLLLSSLSDGLGNMSPVLTGIESCTVNETVNPGLVYDYHGRRVGEDSRGIVIENGRKVLR